MQVMSQPSLLTPQITRLLYITAPDAVNYWTPACKSTWDWKMVKFSVGPGFKYGLLRFLLLEIVLEKNKYKKMLSNARVRFYGSICNNRSTHVDLNLEGGKRF